MDGLEIMKYAQKHDQLVAKLVRKDYDAAEDEDFIVVGDRAVGMPWSKVPEKALAARLAVADVPPVVVLQSSAVNSPTSWQEAMKRNTADLSEDALAARLAVADVPPVVVFQSSAVNPPTSWLEFTVENTANLTEDEIVQLLFFQGRFDVGKFGTVLLLPNGYQIAIQLANRISGNRLLELIGENRMSADDLMCIFFPEEYFAKEGEIDEIPTKEMVGNSVRAECEFLPRGPQKGKFDGLIDGLSQAIIDTYIHKDRREEFGRQLRNVADLIVGKFPPPNAENQVYWDNIRGAIQAMIDESQGTNGDGEEKRARAREGFPSFDF
ncbi:MAG: hypothetical protein LBS22_02235 [Puniceicoccales bacterium]|jgi:hypothetical protein|nr:hypothetical protein [Puniceicoccales bacterium]